MSEGQSCNPKTISIRYSGKEYHFYIADETDHIQKEISATGRFYEQGLLECLAEGIAQGQLVVDVGANIGNHTIFFAAVSGCKVIAVEPNSHLIDILKRNIELNGVIGDVEVVHGAAADSRKMAALCVDNLENIGSGYVTSNSDSGISHGFTEQVECFALDELVGSELKVSLLKIDVEGSELEVLLGAKNILRRDMPTVVVECHNYTKYAEALRFFFELGYFPVHRFNATPTLIFSPGFEGGVGLHRLLAEQVWSGGLQQFESQKAIVGDVGRRIESHSSKIETNMKLLVRKIENAGKGSIDAIEKSISVLRKDIAVNKELEKANQSLVESIEKLKREAAGYRATLEKNNREIKKLRKYVDELESSISFRLGRAIVDAVKTPFPGLFRLPAALVRLARRDVRISPVQGVVAKSPGSSGDAVRSTPDEPLVSIIVTVYNKQDWLVVSLKSLLSQSYRNLEIIVIDDRSTDNSWHLLQQLARKSPQVKIFRNRENRGTYWSKNFGIIHAAGSLITFHDADDVSLPSRIETQVNVLLSNPSLKAVYGRYLRKDADGNIVEINGRSKRPALITLMIKRDVVSDIGYFDSVRYGADSEFLERLITVSGKGAVRLLDDVIYEAPTLADSLTGSGSGRLTYNAASRSFDLPPTREKYVSEFRAWHAQIKSAGQAYVGYPLSTRRFHAATEMLAEPVGFSSKVYASLATMPSRVDSLRQVVDRILPQVDRLYVYLNNFDETPEFLRRDKVVVQHSSETGDLRDNGKFFFASHIGRDAYHFTLDDDIVYPTDYVQRMILTLQKYSNRVILGVHGFNFPQDFVRFFEGRDVLHFRDPLEYDRFVNVLGTGTMAYHTSLLELNSSDFRTTGMVDLWVALAAKANGVPLVSVARSGGWLKPIKNEDSLYLEYRDRDAVQTELVIAAGSWRFVDLAESYLQAVSRIVEPFDDQELVDYCFDVANLNLFMGRKKLCVDVVVTGWNCREEAVACVESILAQRANHFTLSIHVVDDASDDGTYELLAEKYGESNQVVRLLRTDQNMGPAYARMLALNTLHNPNSVVVLVDLDDFLAPDALLRVTQKYHNDPECRLTCGNWKNQHGVPNQQDFYTADEIDGKQYLSMDIFNFSPLRTFVRSVADNLDPRRLQDPGGEWLRYCSDVALMFGLVVGLESRQISFVNAPIYIYNQHRPSGTQNRFRERKREMYKYIQASYCDGV